MTPAAALLVLLLLVALSTGLGLLWRHRQGTVSVGGTGAGRSGDVTVTAAELALTPADAPAEFGRDATLLQFSTEFCSRCPGTRVLLAQVAADRPGVTHVDVDLTHRADLARRFNILQTPTTLVLDAAGAVRARVGGVPDRAALHARLDDLVRTG
ncbi:TlpA family protein disulfide reductase [Cryobacterium arcticum]|uniref:Thiol-disulfide isomerase n=1 Tax=Cryobacterium arcticum TaxID=670052 RepID=A0A1B1BHW0_9MICO|nr:thioredoxin family protein [Cryobacterium arcticum]ANP72104.1 thiol-disulfide isomerase [Cryobacterium arcticum]